MPAKGQVALPSPQINQMASQLQARGCFSQLGRGFAFVAVLIIRALLFGVYITLMLGNSHVGFEGLWFELQLRSSWPKPDVET